MDGEIKSGKGHGHRGRKFRGKRLKTVLPKPQADLPLPEAKSADRVAKVIARAGLGSRREVEGWIEAGRVTVNDARIASPALNVTAKDRIAVDGKPLPQRERTRLFLFHKARGFVTTTADTHGRLTIFSALPKDMPRVVSIGRLDLNTEGLLLLTNDGGLARALELPSTGWLRRYRVRAHGRIDQARLDGLRNGITVDGVNYGAIEATMDREQGANVWLTFAMREGKNREIRNVLSALGLQVNRLIRVSYGPFQLGELPPGAVEEVKTRALRDQIGERIAALAGADFSGPLVDRDIPVPVVPRAPRPPEARGADRKVSRRNDPPRAVERKPEGRRQPAGTFKSPHRRNEKSQGRPQGRPQDRPHGKPQGRAHGQAQEKSHAGKGRQPMGRSQRPPQDGGDRSQPRGDDRKPQHRPYKGRRDR